MRVLVLSDIHANLAALEAVLEDARGDYDAVWCLGDVVGYGPEPAACIARIRLTAAIAVAGNHDWAVLHSLGADEFNPEARRAVVWTRRRIDGEDLAWLQDLPSRPLVMGDITLTHGSPRDPIWEYVLYPATASLNLRHFSTRFCLVGHTHIPALHLLSEADGSVRTISPTVGEPTALCDACRAILNPGSVGQPRDNDPRAAYAVLDTDAVTWEARRVAYPVEVTQARMRVAGLPERLINRLAFGW